MRFSLDMINDSGYTVPMMKKGTKETGTLEGPKGSAAQVAKQKEAAMADTFSIYYRTGGTANFEWHLVFDTYATYQAAETKAAEIRRMGYPAHVEKTRLVKSIGLPETYSLEAGADRPR